MKRLHMLCYTRSQLYRDALIFLPLMVFDNGDKFSALSFLVNLFSRNPILSFLKEVRKRDIVSLSLSQLNPIKSIIYTKTYLKN